VFPKGHTGDLLRVDRKSRPAEHVPHGVEELADILDGMTALGTRSPHYDVLRLHRR
jgi:hypothetical protein